MKISIYGAGAVGGVLGAVLAKQGHEVGLIARGDHLAALKAKGCTLESDDDRFTVHPACSDNPADFGPQDFVIVTVKAPAMPSVADGIAGAFTVTMTKSCGPKAAGLSEHAG